MQPNIVYIYADDLGRGMLSCYGQKHFRTPNIDRLAGEGVRFTRAYGTSFCAPARASLLTGMHDAHAGRWTFNRGGLYERLTDGRMTLDDLSEVVNNTGIRPADGETFLATVAKRAGLATEQIGKLEWGFAASDAEIRAHGWDHHYGYYDHGQCHGFYPPYVFEDGRRVDIPGNTRADFGRGQYHPFEGGVVSHDPTGREVYSQDLFDERILEFLRANRDRPFFLHHPSQLPHGPIYYPDIHPDVADADDLTPAEKEYASMVLRLDRTVGLILDELDRLGIAERTLVIFASDNGHCLYYPQPGRCDPHRDLEGRELDEITTCFRTNTCGDVFDGNDGMAGLKVTNWEGGCRIPFIARWPGRIPAGSVSDHLLANYDTLATFADMLGQEAPPETDGISFLPAAVGKEDAPRHKHIVYASQYGPSLVTEDGWKLRTYLRRDRIVDFWCFGSSLDQMDEAVTRQLYYLPDDYAEEHDLAAERPDKVRELTVRLLRECDGNLVHGTPEAHFAFYPDGVVKGE